ncbi:hypothetical protein FBQ97_05270 [Acidobacteria bacterium ACD]|nr:hypothetical protein [Acidobacteria bacterium ACD]
MTEKSGWGQTVRGWFVVKDAAEAPEAAGEAAPAEPVAEEAQAPLPEPTAPLPAAAGGEVDFPKVFEAFGVDAEERDRFAKAADLLKSLPPGTDAAVQKTIVEASLKAFGIPIEKIIETGVEEIQALEGYQRKDAADAAATSREVQALVEGYEAKIREARSLLSQRLSESAAVAGKCNAKKLEVQRVLEFFGQEAVARVVRDSPRLVEPSAPKGATP